ncbi:MAG: ComEA family DNA-binding protein [Chloroflexota bacterium]|nr:ComEA family DNA-binding protein [Chloroflexota bacterium]
MAQEIASNSTHTRTSSPTQFKWLQFGQQRTEPIEPIVTPISELNKPELSPAPKAKRPYLRYVAVGIVLVLAIALYIVWHTSLTPSTAVSMTQQSFTSSTKSAPLSQTAAATSTGGEIQVYVIGAVQHPGVYNLPAGARVYQLLQAAGGALPNANLVALNLAARLNDGQEVYVLKIGETPPTVVGGGAGPTTTTNTGAGSATGQPVNINTATADELRQSLHVSAKTAQNIITYRLQHGPFSAVSELLNVVSRAIYNRIKDQVTV